MAEESVLSPLGSKETNLAPLQGHSIYKREEKKRKKKAKTDNSSSRNRIDHQQSKRVGSYPIPSLLSKLAALYCDPFQKKKKV